MASIIVRSCWIGALEFESGMAVHSGTWSSVSCWWTGRSQFGVFVVGRGAGKWKRKETAIDIEQRLVMDGDHRDIGIEIVNQKNVLFSSPTTPATVARRDLVFISSIFLAEGSVESVTHRQRSRSASSYITFAHRSPQQFQHPNCCNLFRHLLPRSYLNSRNQPNWILIQVEPKMTYSEPGRKPLAQEKHCIYGHSRKMQVWIVCEGFVLVGTPEGM